MNVQEAVRDFRDCMLDSKSDFLGDPRISPFSGFSNGAFFLEGCESN